MPPFYKKRRVAHGPSKNELRAARGENDARAKARATILGDRFPLVDRIDLDLNLEAVSGATLEHTRRSLAPTDNLLLDIPCPGGCGGGQFLLTEAVERMIDQQQESREGLAICQAASYNDPRNACGTKLRYSIQVHSHEDPAGATENKGEQ